MSKKAQALWDCRAKAGRYTELILTGTRRTAALLKSFRDSDWQALSAIRIARAPLDEEGLRNDEVACMLLIAVGAAASFRYERVIILRSDETEDVGGIIETLRRFRPELLAQGRLFVTKLRGRLDPDEMHRALGAARLVAD